MWNKLIQVDLLMKILHISIAANVHNSLSRCFFYVSAEPVKEITSGLCSYFDKALPIMLLYKSERQQYEEAVKAELPSYVYGAEHLLRLFGMVIPYFVIFSYVPEDRYYLWFATYFCYTVDNQYTEVKNANAEKGNTKTGLAHSISLTPHLCLRHGIFFQLANEWCFVFQLPQWSCPSYCSTWLLKRRHWQSCSKTWLTCSGTKNHLLLLHLY